MALETMVEEIVASLGRVQGLRVYDHVPDSFGELPAVAVRLWGANYTDRTFTFRLLLVAGSWDEAEAERQLRPFLDSGGERSIRSAIETGTGYVMAGAGPTGRQVLGGVPYMGVELTVVAAEA